MVKKNNIYMILYTSLEKWTMILTEENNNEEKVLS